MPNSLSQCPTLSHHRPFELRCGDEVASLEAGEGVEVERLDGGRRRGRTGRRGHGGDPGRERVVAGRRRHRILQNVIISFVVT